VTFVTFLRFFDILGLAKKTKKNTYRVTKTQKCHKVRNCDVVTFGNVTKCHIAKKTKKNTYRVTKTQKCRKVPNCDIVTFGNVTKCHIMSHFFKSLAQSYVYLLCLDPARNGSLSLSHTHTHTHTHTYGQTTLSSPLCSSLSLSLSQKHTHTHTHTKTIQSRTLSRTPSLSL